MSNERTDGGQEFVPFFDATDVKNVSPLSGFGLLHYTNDDEYAGYVRPYLITYNIAAHLNY